MPEASIAGFEEWVAARRGALLRTAYLLTGDPHEAEDLVQATLIRVVPRWARIADAPEPYVRRVLVTTNASRWRRRRWREVHTDTVPDRPAAAPETEAALALRAALRQLSERQRAVLVLRYYEDLGERETADLLGIGVGTVKSHARDALKRLRVLLPGLELEARVGPRAAE
ncbi:SigE family RNA polymerase sigma factor [Nocardioides sp. GY 10113]|uniref:SigE family RNA polymerase sigma factor n=1 Tax=Nocardioides sp. GY 10113 TaxID=2569761 RepID=UPI0010A8C9EB|nr:SigE family RNA polymerase sigma factor [Nocardioides sp. GY 10113]TIC88612.1 SigE family RNA polymerase sigma factor [Nocardioides sp. GY 10113]